MQGVLRKVDFYRRVPKDLTETSMLGAVISICTIILASFLFISELVEYVKVQRTSEMYIERERNNKLTINLDIFFPKIPCELLSLDAQDVMGSHELDVHGNLVKMRIAKDRVTQLGKEDVKGSSLHQAASGLTRHFSFQYDSTDMERIKKMMEDEEGRNYN